MNEFMNRKKGKKAKQIEDDKKPVNIHGKKERKKERKKSRRGDKKRLWMSSWIEEKERKQNKERMIKSLWIFMNRKKERSLRLCVFVNLTTSKPSTLNKDKEGSCLFHEC